MNFPVIRLLKRRFPDCEITLLCQELYVDWAKETSGADQVLPVIPEKLKDPGYFLRLVSEVKTRRFDAVIVSNPSKPLHALARMAGIPVRVGWNRKWGVLLSHQIPDHKSREMRHEADWNRRLVAPWIPEGDWSSEMMLFELGLPHPRARTRLLSDVSRRWIAVHATSSNPAKEWPWASFEKVCDAILKDPECAIVFVGEKPEPNIQSYAQRHSPRTVDEMGKTDLKALTHLLSEADAVISLDSGPLHIAWMRRTPVVGIYSKNCPGSDPIRWGVYGDFCPHRLYHRLPHELKPEEVVEGLYEVLR